MNTIVRLCVFCMGLILAPLVAMAVTIPTVPVGNAGNAGDLSVVMITDGTTGYGSVAYDYRIGTYEVTNSQYAEFLNAKAASDSLGLYNAGMGGSSGGITRSGSSGSYTYATISGRGQMPVNFVSWYDSIRFANWLHNGQGTGDTETGAYTLLGGTPTPSNGNSITRNAGATWFLPSENEWYKAAYHKNDGATGNYWHDPTSSNTAPAAEAPPGGSNSANYILAVDDLTNVGAYAASNSPYGTFDQGGNVWEWNEAFSGSSRGLRGGAWDDGSNFLPSWNRYFAYPPGEGLNIGFRVATVPEPATLTLLASALLMIAGIRVRALRHVSTSRRCFAARLSTHPYNHPSTRILPCQ